MARSGAQIVVDTLIDLGTEIMFGYPGGAVIPVFDVLYDSKLRVILTRHEQAAAHAADGYARATGKVGVCIATSGPGATNLTTGIATAKMDSVPLVAITGQVKTTLIGNDAFQEADVVGVTHPITKHSRLVRSVEELEQVIREAFYIASKGRPGPVVIDLPVDVSTAVLENEKPVELDLPGFNPKYEGNPRQCKLAAEAINASERPVLYVGHGVIISDACKEVRALAKKANIPVTTTLLGLGAFPETDDLSLGMLGMHGTAYANYAIMNADLIIAVGARFDDRVTGKLDEFAPHARIIHIDIDPTSIGKSVRPDIPVVGDAKDILNRILKHVKKKPRKEWFAQIDEWKRLYPLTYDRKATTIKPQYVVEQIYEATRGKAIIATEVGQNQMWAAQFFRFTRPRSLLSSGGLGTMGYGFPASIGAQLGRPNETVIDIAGDGSFQMNIQELATAVQNELPVKVAILNNGYLGMVRQWQELFYNKRYSHTRLDGNPDFVKVAEAYGAVGIRVEKKRDVKPAIKKALSMKRTVVIDFLIEPEENVFPMVPAGKPLHEMIGRIA